MSNSDKSTNQSQKKTNGVWIIFGVLIVWALLIAFGSFQTQASVDVRRPLIVIATMSAFLGVWLVALQLRKKR